MPVQEAVNDAWREGWQQRAAFLKVRRAEYDYARKLRRLASQLHDLVSVIGTENLEALEFAIHRYIDAMRPWAQAVARRFVAEVARRDDKAWQTYSRTFARTLYQEIQQAPLGEALRMALQQQYDAILTLPNGMLEKIHDLIIGEGGTLFSATRSDVLADRLTELGDYSKQRANLIARTETARVAGTLTQVRAQHIGSEEYIWRNVGDARVRPALSLSPATFAQLNTLEKGSHRKLGGTTQRWDSPPVVAPNGVRAHPGQWINCRCFAEPVIPQRFR
jgi:uncharacterized protein with gpF-like domain